MRAKEPEALVSATAVCSIDGEALLRQRYAMPIDQFSNLDGIAGRILGCYEHGPTFFVREILDGIVAKPGGDYIHGGYRHRQVVPQSRLKYHGLPGPPLVRADHES